MSEFDNSDWVYSVRIPADKSDAFIHALFSIDSDFIGEDHLVVVKAGAVL